MATLTNQIEAYIKELLRQSENGVVELDRGYLATVFMCVPSQINYVLETRFKNKYGYLVESRRGGGGYVRVTRLTAVSDEDLAEAMARIGEKPMRAEDAAHILERLVEDEFLSKREGILARALLTAPALDALGEPAGKLRGDLMRQLLLCFLRDDF